MKLNKKIINIKLLLDHMAFTQLYNIIFFNFETQKTNR